MFSEPLRTRREMLQRAGLGIGTLALTTLLAEEGRLLAGDGRPTAPLNGKAKSVIFLFMGGGPSQVDTWDPKPELSRLDGREVPASIAKDVPRIARRLARLAGVAVPIRTPRSERYPRFRVVPGGGSLRR